MPKKYLLTRDGVPVGRMWPNELIGSYLDGDAVWDVIPNVPVRMEVTWVRTRYMDYLCLVRDGVVEARAGRPLNKVDGKPLLDLIERNGLPVKHIAQKVGVPTSTFRYRLLRCGVTPDLAERVEACVKDLLRDDSRANMARDAKKHDAKRMRSLDRYVDSVVWYTQRVRILTEDECLVWEDDSVDRIKREAERYGCGW